MCIRFFFSHSTSQIIQIVKYADELVLIAMEETVLLQYALNRHTVGPFTE